MPPPEEFQLNGGLELPTAPSQNEPKLSGDPSPPTSATPLGHPDQGKIEHIVRLSSLEHCMPRAYIRVCLAYRLPQPEMLLEALAKLKAFVRRTVDAKPYLSGYVVPAEDPGCQIGRVEIRFTDQDFLTFPCLHTRTYSAEEIPFTYDELDKAGMPPSIIRPELVSALPEGANHHRAPVLHVQANVVAGGLVVSFYLHHCISDGTGLGLLISGSVLHDDFKFERHLDSPDHPPPSLAKRLADFADRQTKTRSQLSWSPSDHVSRRLISHRVIPFANDVCCPTKEPGRGCIFTFSFGKLQKLRASLTSMLNGSFITLHDALQAFLWHHMTLARTSSLSMAHAITCSTLLIPINIRSKLEKPLERNYFGAAVDFAAVKLILEHLSRTDHFSLALTALSIRGAIAKVDEPYIRSAIALANSPDLSVDVRDLLASNMNRIAGADMYITSWAGLPLYAADLDMGLGPPDWVRKPWSRDPGSCIILPRDERKDQLEVVVQMTEPDMERLLRDHEFMNEVSRIIE